MPSPADFGFPTSGIHRYVADYIRSLPDLTGKQVLDIPSGDGRSSFAFKQKGAQVRALDLFPGFMKPPDITAEYGDLSEPLPIASDSIDYIICQEGIEHIPNQLHVFKEFNRVLKKGGILLLTTPNMSHVRARLSLFLVGCDSWKNMPPTELDSIWFAEQGTGNPYFGHVFLLGGQQLQSLLTFTGFTVKQRMKTDLGNTSAILGVLFYPLLALVTLVAYALYQKKNPHVELGLRKSILWQRVRLNLSPTSLFYKHIFWESQKTDSVAESFKRLKDMQRK